MSTTISIIILLFLLVISGWLVKKIFFSKKKDPKQAENNTDAKKDKEISNVNTNLIKVCIFRPLSDGLVAQVGDPILCEERKDENNNLLVINEQKKFKEDFSFSIDRVYEIMNFSLKVQNKTKAEKIAIINKAIGEQEKLLNTLDTDTESNKYSNYCDEELKLRQLNIFKDSLRRESTGNYMRLGKGGIRQYELIAIDGILYPYFFGSKRFRVYPDLQVKKKIFNHENSVFRNETSALQKGMLNWITVITLIIGLVMMAGGGFMMSHAYSKNTHITEAANKGAITCNNVMSSMVEAGGETFIEYIRDKKTQKQNNINNEKQSNTIQTPDNIVVDPTKLIKQ